MNSYIEIDERLSSQLSNAITNASFQSKGEHDAISVFIDPSCDSMTLILGSKDTLAKFVIPNVNTSLRNPLDFAIPTNYLLNALQINPHPSLMLKIINNPDGITFDVMRIPSLLKHLATPAISKHALARVQQSDYTYQSASKSHLQLLINEIIKLHPKGLIEYVPETHSLKVQHEDYIVEHPVSNTVRWKDSIIIDSHTLDSLTSFLDSSSGNTVSHALLDDKIVFESDSQTFQFALPERSRFAEMSMTQLTLEISFSCSLLDILHEVKSIAKALPKSPQTYLFFDNGQLIIAPEATDDPWACHLNTIAVSSKKKAAFFFNVKDLLKKMPKGNIDITIEIVRNIDGKYSMMIYTPKHKGATDCILPVYKDDSAIPELLNRKQGLKDKEKENREIEKECEKRGDSNTQILLEI